MFRTPSLKRIFIYGRTPEQGCPPEFKEYHKKGNKNETNFPIKMASTLVAMASGRTPEEEHGAATGHGVAVPGP